MRNPILPVALVCSLLALVGCASTSGSTFAKLDRSHPSYESEQCQGAIRDTEVHDDLKMIRSIASPVAVVLSGGLLLPAVVATNIGLDTVDRVDASKMEKVCGGEGKTAEEIATGVAKGAAFGLATGAAGSAVGASSLPIGTTGSTK